MIWTVVSGALLLAVTLAQSPIEELINLYQRELESARGAPRDTSVFQEEYDFIVIGGGSGGCVVTSRLTENPDWSLLLLEAGKEEIYLTDVPLLVSYVLNTAYNWGYRTQPQEGICMAMDDKRCSWPRGKALGGTSVVNYMVYTRGFKGDYDLWSDEGNPGWNSSEVLPYFLKFENVSIPSLTSSGWYSSGGYLDVERPKWRTPLAKAFLRAGRRFGYTVGDSEGFTPAGFSYVLSTTRRGSRLSASKAFLWPVRDRPNLFISKRSRATRILLDPVTRRAYGVEFVKDRRRYTVRARKEVILSAGALNSPQLLMLSGIGPADHLSELGIPVFQDLKVGENLQDHVSMAGLVFFVNESVSIIEERYRNPRYTFDYVFNGRGPYTLPGGAEAVAFINTDLNRDQDLPDMELVFGPGAFTGDTGGSLRKSFAINETFYQNTFGPYVGRDAFSIVPVLLKPKSKGLVRLRSKNPFQWPLFYSNYYSNKEDMDRLIDGILKAVEIGESEAFKRWGSRAMRRKMFGCKDRWGTRAYWECAIRHMTTNLHHQVGTCKMGPRGDPDSVVDPRLRVIGVQGLRVVDASIMPTIPSGHTNSIVFMIGEKAAHFIKQDYNYTQSD